MLKKSLILTMFLIMLQCLFISTASAQTRIDDDTADINSAVTWDLANSPYIITTDVSVGTEGSLTIEPGVVVKFYRQTGLYVEGTLNAQGTANEPIVFTDFRDDAAGGDTNGDGVATAPTAGWWSGIKISGTATINNGVVRYAGYYNEADIYKTGTEPLSLTNTTMSNSSNDGLRIRYSDGATAVNNCTFKDNKRYGVYCEDIETDSYTGTGNTFTNNSKAPVCINGGTLKHDVAWNLEASPYYISNDVTVDQTAALTLSPGVIVKFAKETGLYIEGTLNATGSTDQNTIYFTDYRDDVIGGDTNGDSAATKPAAGWWAGIKISDAGTATMMDCGVRYGGYYNESGIYKTGIGLLTLANSTISDSSNDGLRIRYSDGATAVNNCTFKDNKRYGVYCEDIETDSYTGTGNTFTNNSKAPVCIDGGTLKHDVAWNLEASPYYISDDVTVDDNAVLTVNSGVVAKFAQSKGLSVTGTLTAKGNPTGSGPNGTIYFTDYRDDLAGGDTNGDGAATKPASSWWYGINLSESGTATLDYCVVRYGGNYYNTNINKAGTGALSLTNSEISNSSAIGVQFYYDTGACNIAKNRIYSNKVGISCLGSSPLIGGSLANANQIYQNSDFGVENKSDDVTVNAKYNWWGDPTGPTHATNRLGKGDRVTDYVDFGNFLTSISTTSINEVLTVSNPATTGFKVTLNPALAGLTKNDFVLKDEQNNVVTITSAATTDNGATYTISAALTAGKNYAVTAVKTGYDFGTAQSVVVSATLSSDTTVTSSVYTVSGTTINNVPVGTAKAAFLANLSKGESHQTWNTIGVTDPVVSGNKIVVMAQDGITQVTYTITIGTVPDVHPTSISLNKSSLNLVKGKTEQLVATVSPSNATNMNVTWSSSDPSVATVDALGIVTAVSPGTNVKITVSTTDGNKQAYCNVTVTDNTVPELLVEPSSVCVAYGKTQKLKISTVDVNGNKVDVTKLAKLVSDDPDIATVTRGTIKGICVGTTSISVTYLDMTAVIDVTVAPPLKTLTADPSVLNLTIDGSETVTLTAIYKDDSEDDVTESATWKSSKPSVATVDEYGTVTGVAIGSTKITGTYGGKTATITVNVTPELDYILVQPGNVGVAKGKTQLVTIYAVYADGSKVDITKTIRLTSDDKTVATVTGATIKGITADCDTIVRGTYLEQDIEIPVKVTQPLKTLVADTGTSGLNLSIDESETITLTATYNDGFTEDVNEYATGISSKPSVATVDVEDGNITVTGLAKGSATITLSYEGKKVTVKVIVTA